MKWQKAPLWTSLWVCNGIAMKCIRTSMCQLLTWTFFLRGQEDMFAPAALWMRGLPLPLPPFPPPLLVKMQIGGDLGAGYRMPMKVKKGIGPKSDPWGTPWVRRSWAEGDSPFTICVMSFRYLLNHIECTSCLLWLACRRTPRSIRWKAPAMWICLL